MKKIVCLTIFLIFCSAAFAQQPSVQIEKGYISVNGASNLAGIRCKPISEIFY